MNKIKKYFKKNFIIILFVIISGIIFFYQTKKVGFHEDEIYTICSSVNSINGLLSPYDYSVSPIWITKEYVKNYITLNKKNLFNFKALYLNQAYDNHPPLFYTLVHFSIFLLDNHLNIYSVFLVNIIAFILSLLIIKKILILLNKENLIIPITIFYGLSMGTISMVILQRMYMLLTFFTLLYFYFNLKLYKNNFIFDNLLAYKFGFTVVLGFLTQYFFTIFAFVIFLLMIVKMFKTNNKDKIRKYLFFHILYAFIGIILFIPSIYHILFSNRGLSNLENSSYWSHILEYIKLINYSFTINNTNTLLIFLILILFLLLSITLIIKSRDKFIPLITIVPSIIYFFIVVAISPFQELRYIMPIIPFISLNLFFILDKFITFKYKEILIIILSIIFIIPGFIFSKPKFLYENYQNALKIANDNFEKSFVYIYDNDFNHMQSIPEMMIYKKTLVININKDELNYVYNDITLNKENSFILSIKSYMNNEEILDKIINNSNFNHIKLIYKNEVNNSSDSILNNYYLITKQ